MLRARIEALVTIFTCQEGGGEGSVIVNVVHAISGRTLAVNLDADARYLYAKRRMLVASVCFLPPSSYPPCWNCRCHRADKTLFLGSVGNLLELVCQSLGLQEVGEQLMICVDGASDEAPIKLEETHRLVSSGCKSCISSPLNNAKPSGHALHRSFRLANRISLCKLDMVWFAEFLLVAA